MSKHKKINFIIFFLSASSLLLFGAVYSASAENKSENVKNSVSASASTGGNTISGNGTITTSDATATVNAKNYVNGGENVENKVEARAEAQGDGAKASVEVNGEEKSCVAENGEGCEVEIVKNDNSASASAETENTAENIEAEKNMVEKITDLAKNLTDKIISWFS